MLGQRDYTAQRVTTRDLPAALSTALGLPPRAAETYVRALKAAGVLPVGTAGRGGVGLPAVSFRDVAGALLAVAASPTATGAADAFRRREHARMVGATLAGEDLPGDAAAAMTDLFRLPAAELLAALIRHPSQTLWTAGGRGHVDLQRVTVSRSRPAVSFNFTLRPWGVPNGLIGCLSLRLAADAGRSPLAEQIPAGLEDEVHIPAEAVLCLHRLVSGAPCAARAELAA